MDIIGRLGLGGHLLLIQKEALKDRPGVNGITADLKEYQLDNFNSVMSNTKAYVNTVRKLDDSQKSDNNGTVQNTHQSALLFMRFSTIISGFWSNESDSTLRGAFVEDKVKTLNGPPM